VCREADWIEIHGERCHEEWWECAVCGEKFTGEELDTLYGDERRSLEMVEEKAA